MKITHRLQGNLLFIDVSLYTRQFAKEKKYVVLGDTITNYFLSLSIKHEEWVLLQSDFCANHGNMKKFYGTWTYKKKVVEIVPTIVDNMGQAMVLYEKPHPDKEKKPKKEKDAVTPSNNKNRL